MVQLKLGVVPKTLDLYDKETVQNKLVTDAVCHSWCLFCKHLCHYTYVLSPNVLAAAITTSMI